MDARTKTLIEKLIAKYGLDLQGLTVFTEAATGSYKFTPVIAAIARAAHVYAVAADSRYGSKEEVRDGTLETAGKLGIRDTIEVVFQKRREFIGASDIITNLGFVRPITSNMVSWMKSTAVIPLMWLVSEFRPHELDLQACVARGIVVMGTNEHHPLLRLFDSIGFKICKLLFHAGLSVYNDRYLLVSSGDMGNSISDFFFSNKIEFDRVVFDDETPRRYRAHIRSRAEVIDSLHAYDAIIMAELTHNVDILSATGFIETKRLRAVNPYVRIIHTYGSVNAEDIQKESLELIPPQPREFPYGTVCADFLGEKPVLDLITAGLKVGEVMAKCRLNGMTGKEVEEYALSHSPAEMFAVSPSRGGGP
jgi:hypothetical protein